ncbi:MULTISPECIES: PaaX family transcriptional regulator [unclassified Streptomyces]|jgi:phenylacetic acid degradation operon negative regulatory protein|uniref:PaaX family transcriptional regulator n=1 Tax=unclassified Streptomyces TaxID=2593676 RepID=UPI002E821936|nr:PaaX family transcriptional regulator C-terminal domain-containing protein [Streptomyces sp. NBC_00588]WUB35350.1 PaaX family transcriptional regulator [Streptomyces sp. NBC_00588]
MAKDASARPVVSRRREVGDTSARSLLMTILGEYVLPRGRPVWTSALVEALALFGVEEKSARQALARTAAEGWLASERVGRRTRWALTPPGRRLLTEGAQRIYDFGSEERTWDGTWLMVLVSVPESKRDLRHRVRTRLSWAGFGSPEPGVWITPRTDREPEALGVLKELGLADDAMSFTAAYGAVGSEPAMVARAWDLSEVEDRYEAFIDEFTGLHPADGDAVLHALTGLVHAWRRFPFLDPRLPSKLLPAGWSGARAAALFHTKHAEWSAGAQQRWEELAGRDAP